MNKNNCYKKVYAENGIRTHAGKRPPDLKSGSLPGFDISANKKKIINLLLYWLVMIYILIGN